MGFRTLFFTLILALPQVSMATITITSATGYSVFDNTTDGSSATTGTPYIYGGTAGAGLCTTNTGTCNSCEFATGTAPCNEAMISPTTVLTLNISSDSEAAGTLIATDISGDSGALITSDTSDAAHTGASDTTNIQITWANICTALVNDPICTTTDIISNDSDANEQNYFYIGIDADGDFKIDDGEEQLQINIRVKQHTNLFDFDCTTTGVVGLCGIAVYPGDEKVFIISISKPDQTTTVIEGDFDVKSVIVMYSTGAFTDLNLFTSERREFALTVDDSAITVNDDRITDLTNDVLYNFRFASKDEAGNIFDLQGAASISATLYADAGCDGNAECDYTTTPSEVYGLLVDDMNCFIATASYGSTLHENLSELRQFKLKVLARTEWGRKFIQYYYQQGPKAAQWIYDHPQFRPVAQAFIWPAWAFSYASVNWGFGISVFIFSLGLFLVFTLIFSLIYFLTFTLRNKFFLNANNMGTN
jgi:hypothetical protein